MPRHLSSVSAASLAILGSRHQERMSKADPSPRIRPDTLLGWTQTHNGKGS